jgi:hypothetical protein
MIGVSPPPAGSRSLRSSSRTSIFGTSRNRGTDIHLRNVAEPRHVGLLRSVPFPRRVVELGVAPAVEDDKQDALPAAPRVTGSQRRAVHSGRLLKSECGKNGRGNVGKFAVAQGHGAVEDECARLRIAPVGAEVALPQELVQAARRAWARLGSTLQPVKVCSESGLR